MVAVGIAAAGPALGYNITVASKATSYGGAGTLFDADFGPSTATPRITCVVGSSSGCAGAATGVVVLSAVPAVGSIFSGWSNCPNAQTTYGVETGHFCVLPNTVADKRVYAYFKPTAYTVTVKPGAGGTITVGANAPCAASTTCAYALAAGAAVVLTATAEPGKLFGSWAGCSSQTATCSLVVDGAKLVSASFFAATEYDVVVTVSGNAPAGSVTGPGIACPGDCTATVAPGASVTLTAAGTGFQQWDGCTVAAGNVCELTDVASNQAVTATYATTSCGACHGKPPPSPHAARTDCGTCHTGYTEASVVRETHMNGRVDPTHAEAVGDACTGDPDVEARCVNCHPCFGL
jgi:hypothetical protein